MQIEAFPDVLYIQSSDIPEEFHMCPDEKKDRGWGERKRAVGKHRSERGAGTGRSITAERERERKTEKRMCL